MSEEVIDPGFTRVTEILKKYSGLEKIDPLVLANAARRGKEVHRFCEMICQDIFISEEIPIDCRGYVESFTNWWKFNKHTLMSHEERIYDRNLMLTGKYDMIVLPQGTHSRILIDIKTPLSTSKTWPIQLAAYRMMIENSGKTAPERMAVLQVKKDGSPATFREYTTIDSYQQIFIQCLSLHRYFNG